jgi:hypothetical protein
MLEYKLNEFSAKMETWNKAQVSLYTNKDFES